MDASAAPLEIFLSLLLVAAQPDVLSSRLQTDKSLESVTQLTLSNMNLRAKQRLITTSPVRKKTKNDLNINNTNIDSNMA